VREFSVLHDVSRSSSSVYLSSAPLLPPSKGVPVAVKVITRAVMDGQFVGHAGDDDELDRGDFDSMSHEILILSRLSHPNIVRCYGGCLRPPRVFVVQGETRMSMGRGLKFARLGI